MTYLLSVLPISLRNLRRLTKHLCLTLKAGKERNAVSLLNSSATPPVPVRVPSVVVHVASKRTTDDAVVRVAARGADVPPFLPAQKQDFFIFSIFVRNNPKRYSLILLFVYSRYSSALPRGIFSSFHLFNAQRPRLTQTTFEASSPTLRANGPQTTPSLEWPPA